LFFYSLVVIGGVVVGGVVGGGGGGGGRCGGWASPFAWEAVGWADACLALLNGIHHQLVVAVNIGFAQCGASVLLFDAIYVVGIKESGGGGSGGGGRGGSGGGGKRSNIDIRRDGGNSTRSCLAHAPCEATHAFTPA